MISLGKLGVFVTLIWMDDISGWYFHDRGMDGDIMIYHEDMDDIYIYICMILMIYMISWNRQVLTTFIPCHGMAAFRGMVRFSAVEPSKQKPCSGGPFWGSQEWEGNNQ